MNEVADDLNDSLNNGLQDVSKKVYHNVYSDLNKQLTELNKKCDTSIKKAINSYIHNERKVNND